MDLSVHRAASTARGSSVSYSLVSIWHTEMHVLSHTQRYKGTYINTQTSVGTYGT